MVNVDNTNIQDFHNLIKVHMQMFEVLCRPIPFFLYYHGYSVTYIEAVGKDLVRENGRVVGATYKPKGSEEIKVCHVSVETQFLFHEFIVSSQRSDGDNVNPNCRKLER